MSKNDDPRAVTAEPWLLQMNYYLIRQPILSNKAGELGLRGLGLGENCATACVYVCACVRVCVCGVYVVCTLACVSV